MAHEDENEQGREVHVHKKFCRTDKTGKKNCRPFLLLTVEEAGDGAEGIARGLKRLGERGWDNTDDVNKVKVDGQEIRLI